MLASVVPWLHDWKINHVNHIAKLGLFCGFTKDGLITSIRICSKNHNWAVLSCLYDNKNTILVSLVCKYLNISDYLHII